MMNRQTIKLNKIIRRKHRTRSKISGTAKRPRLSVFRSLRHITAQLIDDTADKTLASATDTEVKAKGTPVEVAKAVGAAVAAKATKAGITEVIFDRGPYKYHGRVQALADGAREGGLKF